MTKRKERTVAAASMKVKMAGRREGTVELPKTAKTVFCRLARLVPWGLAFGAILYGGVTCSGRGTTNPDGHSSWEFLAKVSAGAEVQGAAESQSPKQASKEP
ncbi:hypothetical protein [Corallococcus exiguus]|uniref:Uncharacterized protein n=1 Tax=Corallococcus exiguus TaxID=83462 RepID=A0A7X4YG73_9BACT|nr:hypothetical protein [Corallococcus exiguus]NBC44823.1 hypothetical protein [Corallococcus exiguus]TNV66197.1 hypothetical protein FH620_07515 [Corallococcus exiguus]